MLNDFEEADTTTYCFSLALAGSASWLYWSSHPGNEKYVQKTALRKIFINAIESRGWIPNSLNTGTAYKYLGIEMQRIICPLNA